MKDITCMAYIVSDFCTYKLNTYDSSDDSRDAAMCEAFVNSDTNHIYFVSPKTYKVNYTHSCLWCKSLINQNFCHITCELAYNKYLNNTLPVQYRYAQI